MKRAFLDKVRSEDYSFVNNIIRYIEDSHPTLLPLYQKDSISYIYGSERNPRIKIINQGVGSAIVFNPAPDARGKGVLETIRNGNDVSKAKSMVDIVMMAPASKPDDIPAQAIIKTPLEKLKEGQFYVVDNTYNIVGKVSVKGREVEKLEVNPIKSFLK